MTLEELIAIAKRGSCTDDEGTELAAQVGVYNELGEKWAQRTDVDPAIKSIAGVSTLLIGNNPKANKAAYIAANMDGDGMSSVFYTFMLSLIGMLIDEGWIVLGKEGNDGPE